MLIDCELAYMNTNHEDFIGFAKYVTFKSFYYSLSSNIVLVSALCLFILSGILHVFLLVVT